jgi:hypothetical protein
MVHASSSARWRVRFTSLPKPGGVRVLSHLDADLDAAYASAVIRVMAVIERRLGPRVLANRVATASQAPPRLVLRPWRDEHTLLRAALERMSATGRLVLRTDVVACYPSILPPAVADGLERCGAPATAVERCTRVLDELAAEGVRGLPVGPAASAILANAVLTTGDATLQRLGLPFVRWVDDWWIQPRSPSHASELLGALGESIAPAGLRLNEVKTRLCQPGDPGGGPSPAGYHRAAHADALPIIPGSNAVVPGDGGVGAGRRPSHRASGRR